MIPEVILFGLSGFFAKLTDNLVDERFVSRDSLKYFTAIMYGAVAGYLASASADFATLIFGIMAGNIAFGRIDHKAHQLGVAVIIAVVAVFGLAQINALLFIAFALLAWLDEFLNDLEKSPGVLGERPMLPLACIAIGAFYGNWIFLMAIVAFDASYRLADYAMGRLMKKFQAEFGPQLAIDCYKCKSKSLSSEIFVKKFLLELAKTIGMKPISEPATINYSAEKADDNGISGFILIAESHISIHTYPARALAKVDIVSCKEFDQASAAEFVRKKLEAEDMVWKRIERGKEYPKDVEEAKGIIERERKSA